MSAVSERLIDLLNTKKLQLSVSIVIIFIDEARILDALRELRSRCGDDAAAFLRRLHRRVNNNNNGAVELPATITLSPRILEQLKRQTKILRHGESRKILLLSLGQRQFGCFFSCDVNYENKLICKIANQNNRKCFFVYSTKIRLSIARCLVLKQILSNLLFADQRLQTQERIELCRMAIAPRVAHLIKPRQVSKRNRAPPRFANFLVFRSFFSAR